MLIVGIVVFQNEERYLPTLLASLARQSRPLDQLLLVDDGSTDRSPEIASAFAAEHAYVRVLRRPVRPDQRDRLYAAGELVAFQWAVPQARSDWDVVAKIDGDLEFADQTVATVEAAFAADERLGMAGPYLSQRLPDGSVTRERCPPDQVRGPTKFYRRSCFEEIYPLPTHLGWDTIDQLRAQVGEWGTRSLDVPGGDTIHLRTRGSYDGQLRGWRRWGVCAWGYGEHPLHVLAVAAQRWRDPPAILGSASYILGWAGAGLRRHPRAEPALRAHVRRDQRRRLRRRLLSGPRKGGC